MAQGSIFYATRIRCDPLEIIYQKGSYRKRELVLNFVNIRFLLPREFWGVFGSLILTLPVAWVTRLEKADNRGLDPSLLIPLPARPYPQSSVLPHKRRIGDIRHFMWMCEATV